MSGLSRTGKAKDGTSPPETLRERLLRGEDKSPSAVRKHEKKKDYLTRADDLSGKEGKGEQVQRSSNAENEGIILNKSPK